MAGDILAACTQALMGFVSIFLMVVTSYLLFIYYQHRRYDHIPGPKRSSFVLGNYGELRKRFQQRHMLSEIALEWMIKYGLTVKMNILHTVMVITADLDSVKDLLITGGHPKAYSNYKHAQHLFGHRFAGLGLVSETDTKAWEKKRAIMNPAFHRGFLKSLMPQFNDSGDRFMNKFATLADGKTKISLGHYFHLATMDVIGQVAFGMDPIENDDCPFPRAVFKVLEGFTARTKMQWLEAINPFYKYNLKKDTREAITLLRQTGKECIAARKSALAGGQNIPKDILSYILQTNENNPDVTEENLLDDFVTMIIAGQETTANTTSFALLQLGREPHIYKRLKEEVDTVIGSKVEVTYEDVGKLEYMSMVLKETLRLYPVVAATFRELEHDHTVGGYVVPAKTDVYVSMYASARLPQFHPDPLRFDPERFHPKSKNRIKVTHVLNKSDLYGRTLACATPKSQFKYFSRPNTYAYFPFSIGPRSCIGQTFAQIEAKVLLSKFIQRFDMQLDPTQSFDILEAGTLRPKDGAMATLTLR